MQLDFGVIRDVFNNKSQDLPHAGAGRNHDGAKGFDVERLTHRAVDVLMAGV